jgi:hypothetical protein
VRRLVPTVLIALFLVAVAVPAAAFARARDRSDGTLAIKNATGTIQIVARGSILGSIDSGSVWITDWNPTDDADPQVYGAEKSIAKSELTTVYRGRDIRFRFVSGRYTIRVVGSGVDVAAVGTGTLRLTGLGTFDDGSYSLDGTPFKSVPSLPFVGVFGGQAATNSPTIPVGG